MKIKKFTEECIRQNPLPKRKVLGLWSILLGCEDGPLIFLTISWGHKGWVLLAWGPQLCCFRQIRWPPWQAALWWPKLWIKIFIIRILSELEFKICILIKLQLLRWLLIINLLQNIRLWKLSSHKTKKNSYKEKVVKPKK